MGRKLPAAAWILIAMAMGVVIGYMVFINFPDKESATRVAGDISIVSDVFLRLITLSWFVTTSLVSLMLGLITALITFLKELGADMPVALATLGRSEIDAMLAFASQAAALTCLRRGPDLPKRHELSHLPIARRVPAEGI